jgi:hypothetical protein
VLRIGFGVTLSGDDDPYIQIAIDANHATAKGGSPGATVVDYFLFLSTLPNWIVRSQTLMHARDWTWAIRRLHDVPFAAVREEFVSIQSLKLLRTAPNDLCLENWNCPDQFICVSSP